MTTQTAHQDGFTGNEKVELSNRGTLWWAAVLVILGSCCLTLYHTDQTVHSKYTTSPKFGQILLIECFFFHFHEYLHVDQVLPDRCYVDLFAAHAKQSESVEQARN